MLRIEEEEKQQQNESPYQQSITMRVFGDLVCIHPGAGMQVL